MSDKQGWKERLRGDVRLTLPEKPDIVGRYTSCERFLPEEQKPVRAWIAAGAACAAVLIALAAVTIPDVAGSLPKGAPQDTYRVWTSACKKAGARVFLDADGALLAEGLKAAPYLIKPNDDELSRLAGKKLETIEELTTEGQKLLESGIERVVISLGGRGALYLRKGSTIYAEGLKVPVGSTVGAGDSVVAALAYAESQDMSEEDAVRLSTATGAANVMCSGTQAAERSVIEELLPKVRFSKL